jgi:outer membrane protein assembly factor BamD (BamD/ComL family)
VGDTLFGRAKAPEESKNESELEQALTSLPASKYEWAVQAFETGQYESALEKFLSLEREGAAQPGFELIPYYIGMCHYQMQQWDGAITNLKKFIKFTNFYEFCNQQSRIYVVNDSSSCMVRVTVSSE